MEGVVKFFNTQKGFGFITGDDSKDYFCHVTGILNNEEITEHDRVSFNIEKGDRGLKAIAVKKI